MNRADDVAELRLLLRGMLRDNDPNEPTGVLVKGDSGVGKSIFSRQVIRDLKTELSNKLVVLEVDGGKLNGVRGLLKKLSKLTLEEIARLNEPELLRQAHTLTEIADYGKISSSQISQITSGATVGGEIGGSFWGLLTTKVTSSLTGSETTSRTEAYEIQVTDDYLSELLNAILRQMQASGYQVLIFLDNLDRIGRTDSKEEADAIAAFLKELMAFSSCVLLLNLRTQFAHHTTDRRGLQTMALDGLSKEALLDILDKRLVAYDLSETDKQKLDAVGFHQIAEDLAELTGNALAFLRWLDFWLTRTSNSRDNLAQDFKKYLRNNYPGVPPNWLKEAVKILRQARADSMDYASLSSMPPEQVAQLERAAAIEPDDLMTEPIKRRYRLTHSLDFLLDPQDRFADALK
ncbi:MAG: P-loop NTPase fold protein [Blastocatellia bacterium]